MRKGLIVLCGLVLIVTLSSCIRAYKFTKERVDAQVAGNQGVIYGPTPAPHKVANPERDLYGVDIELPTMGGGKEAPNVEKQRPAQGTQMTGTAPNVSAKTQEAPVAAAPKKAEKIK